MATHEYHTERWLEKKLQLQGAFLEWEGRSYNTRLIQYAEIVLHPLKSGKYRSMLYCFLLQWAFISSVIALCAIHWLNTPLAILAISFLSYMIWKNVPPIQSVLYIRLFRSTITVPIGKNEIPQARVFLEKVLRAGECK
jgi:hypothetical protein